KFFAVLVIGIILAIVAILPPTPLSEDAPADQFSSGRAMQDVRIIAAEPHPTGTPENAKVRAYLQTRLIELGLEVSTSESQIDELGLKRLNRWKGESKTEQTIVNIIGVMQGVDRSKPALLLMAHHDTVWESPGAADATIGVASILEIIRAIKLDSQPARDVIVLFTDAEEVGLVGAENFFRDNPMADTIGAVLNFEARGGGGTTNMFQTSANNGNAAALYAKSVKQPSASSLSIYVYNALPNDTDLTPALEKDYVAYNFAHIGRAGLYHSPKIDADALEERTLQHMGSQGLDLTRALLAAIDFPAQKRDATFFDVFGFFTIIYPPALGWLFLISTTLCFTVFANFKQRRADFFNGAVRMVSFLVVGGAVLYALNWLSGANAGSNYYDRLAAIPKLEVVAILAGLALAIGFFGTSKYGFDKFLGAAFPILLIGFAGQALAPTATYFISLSLLMCVVPAYARHRWPDNALIPWVAALLAALVVGYMIMLGHLLLLGVGPTMLPVAILTAAIAVMALLPFWQGLTKSRAKMLALVGLALAVVLALYIRLDPMAATVPIYSLPGSVIH
ncbi:MAG: M20/M25/M40 family metallo-hydrolase, partial [Acidimicrobiales bacterium]